MRHRGIAAPLGVAVAVAVAVLACRQLVGIGDDPPHGQQGEAGAEVEAGVCGLAIPGACGTCIATSCCPQASACAASPACSQYGSCLLSCNADVACRAQCAIENATTAAGDEGAALFACSVSRCPGECTGMCGGLDIGNTPDAALACADCVSTAPNGCESAQACASSPACSGIVLCVQACQGRVVCTNTCLSPADAGDVSDFYAWTNQVNGTCRPQCVGSGDWSCLGRLAIPPPEAAATALTLSLYAPPPATVLPVSGVSAQVCAESAETCAPVMGTSDDNGNVPVSVPLPISSEQGLLVGPTGFVRLSPPADAGLATELFYWGDPLSQAAGRASVPIISAVDEQGVALNAGVSLDSMRGHLLAVSFDCATVEASGVQMTVVQADAMTTTLYQSGQAFPPGGKATDATGTVLFLNLPPVLVQVLATQAGVGTVSKASVLVKPDTLTVVYMPPTG